MGESEEGEAGGTEVLVKRWRLSMMEAGKSQLYSSHYSTWLLSLTNDHQTGEGGRGVEREKHKDQINVNEAGWCKESDRGDGLKNNN